MTNSILLTVILVIALIVANGCRRALTELELIDYIKDPANGLILVKGVNDVQIRVYCRPSDLLIAQELKSKNLVTDSMINRYRMEYGDRLYFTMSIMKNGGEVLNSYSGNRQEYGAMVQQLAFGLDQKVVLTTSVGDTLQLIDYIFTRTYGYAPTTDLLFVFDRKNLAKSEWISLKLEDFGLSTGDLRFKFYTRDIKRMPKLLFK